MRGRRNLMLAALLFALLPFTAYSQTAVGPPCADRAHIVASLRERFGEHLTGYGLAESGVLFEVYAAADGAWTLIITRVDGTSCLVASGAYWQTVKQPAFGI